MAGLSSALSSALSGLLVTSSQSALVSRNVTRAADADYSRRDVGLSIAGDGTTRLGDYTRSADKSLQDRVLKTSSQLGDAQIRFDALTALSATIGDPQDNSSVAAGLYQLQQSLRDFQNNPASGIYAATTLSDARSLATRLNQAAQDVSDVRAEAHSGVKLSVEKINALLSDLQPIDEAIRSGKGRGTEGNLDNLDKRDAILKQLSTEVGLRVVNKSDGTTALYTDSGITLFDVTPRLFEVKADGPLIPGTAGPVVTIDGVQVSGSNAIMSLSIGKLAAQISIRDDTSVTLAAQLDEMARSLISLFSEQDQSATPVLPAATGLFTYNGAPAVPVAGTLIPGLAGQLQIDVRFDDRAGGNPMLLRDGGSNGAAYVYNTAGQSGFQERLSELADTFDAPFSFDVAAKLGSSSSIKTFSQSSSGKLSAERATSSGVLDQTKAVNQRWTEALLSKTGVNLDEEMSALLSLEKSFQASAKVMTTVDQMFAVLVGIVR
jgi:flagellar hook-associated protein 1